MFSGFVIFGTIGALALVLILALGKLACFADQVRFLQSELEASDQLVKNRDREIETVRGKVDGALERARSADARVEASHKIRDAALASVTEIQVKSTEALVSFQFILQDIFGKETGKPLDQRLRNAFAKNGIEEIKLFNGDN
jgi:hypothetical protein